MSKAIIQNSGTVGVTPSDMLHGELAINYTDGIAYYKDDDNVIRPLINANAPQVLGAFHTHDDSTLSVTHNGNYVDVKVADGGSGTYNIIVPRRYGTMMVVRCAWVVAQNNANNAVAKYTVKLTQGGSPVTGISEVVLNDADNDPYKVIATEAYSTCSTHCDTDATRSGNVAYKLEIESSNLSTNQLVAGVFFFFELTS